ncbi:4Fe-4S dicluster domain-containing protein [Patescibacteria group bacterium]|nr:4Fe-4S dicluster domain-containing protein [Patescibacteria group bacterium]
MDLGELQKFVENLLSDNIVYAPMKKEAKVFVSPINNFAEIDWTSELPANSFKSVFLPPEEILWKNAGKKFKTAFASKKTIALAMNVLDLQAFTLFEHVFEKDIYYQRRRQNTFVVGFTAGLPDDFRKYKIFHADYEENVLEHLIFDIFIEKQKNGNFIFFSGSEKGQKLLEENNVKDYEHIEFAGLVPESGMNPRLIANRKAVELSFNDKLWDELAEICLACGKCSVVCPTCFCFNLEDDPQLNGVERKRQWTSCFYPEFSKICGNKKELAEVKKKLYFWYYHKFVRIPEELSYYGCVSCMRCFNVCPVGINIAANLQRLAKNQQK